MCDRSLCWEAAGGRAAELSFGAELTPILRAGEFSAHVGQYGFIIARVRMRGTEDPPPPLDHVLHDALGFEKVVACVEISLPASADWC